MPAACDTIQVAMNLDYFDPHCRQTLRTALAELRAAEGADQDAASQMAPELIRDLDIHDAIHVIFGCSTDLPGEVLAHVWTILGTSARVRDLHRVMSHRDHREALAKIGHGPLLRMWITSIPRIASTMWRASRMTRRLRIEDMASLLDQPLAEIRHHHGIRLPRQSPGSKPSIGAAVRKIRRDRASSVA